MFRLRFLVLPVFLVLNSYVLLLGGGSVPLVISTLGLACNFAAVGFNGWKMPVKGARKYVENDTHRIATPKTKLPLLCDWIGNKYFRVSPGDLLLTLGFVLRMLR